MFARFGVAIALVIMPTSPATAAATPRAMMSLPSAASLASPPGATVGPANWRWPVVGPVFNPFDPPDTPFGAGHRGIDIAVPAGTVIVAPEAATVSFAGKVGGELFVTLDHGGGLESTYSWVSSILVHKRDVVARGQPIALSGRGHPGATVPHLHLGVKLDDVYQDPMDYLGPVSVSSFIRLAPM
jgi:murein DD-endopeptidase MepM/ murein hydrolase activator NlpD